LKDLPDIAIEVVLTSGGIEKLPVYAGLGVREVWFWEDDAFHLHALRVGVRLLTRGSVESVRRDS